MSLNVVPVCASCGKSSPAVSASCTKCLRICCAACFGGLVSSMLTTSVDVALLTARICRKCNDVLPVANGTARKETDAEDQAASTTRIAADKELCLLHEKRRTLYCVNCSVAICGSCIELGEPHDFHRVDNLAAVYRCRASCAGTKLTRAEQLNDAETAMYRKNLAWIEKEEAFVLEELETLVEDCKQYLFHITTGRKKALQEKLKVPIMNGAILKDLRAEARELSPYELLERLPAFENECDRLIGQKNDVTLQEFDDIHCVLIPPYRFTDVKYHRFVQAVNDDVLVHFKLKLWYDVEWLIKVRKADMLQVEPDTDPEILKFRHMLVVVIPHADYSKTVNQSFAMDGGKNTFDVVPSAYLVEDGFCSEGGHLPIRIGIRCLDSRVERHVLEYQYSLLRNYVVTYYHPKLSELADYVVLESSHLQDSQSRSWALTMQLVSKSDDVGLFVDLKRGPDTRSDIFIELKHTDHTKTIMRRTSYAFSKADYYKGWYSFIKFSALKNDAGFHPDGRLHIRFGVHPLTRYAFSSVPGAAKA